MKYFELEEGDTKITMERRGDYGPAYLKLNGITLTYTYDRDASKFNNSYVKSKLKAKRRRAEDRINQLQAAIQQCAKEQQQIDKALVILEKQK